MNAGKGLVLPVCLIGIWEIAASASGSPSDNVVPPSAVLRALWGMLSSGVLLDRTIQTLASAGTGLVYGAVLGLAGGLVLGLSPRVARLLDAPIELLRPMPSVALIPLAMMAFGFGIHMESAVVGFATFWPILILVRGAVASVDRRLIEVADVLQLGYLARVLKIVLPSVAPRLIVALRLAIGIALVVAVTVEIVANPYGLGYGLVTAQVALKPAEMFGYLLWVGVLGWALNLILVKTQGRLMASLGLGSPQEGVPS